MTLFENLISGFIIAMSPVNFFWCFVGVVLGTVVGILPGIGPSGALAMLLPLTYSMNPTTGIIMLAGIYYGAKYGGSTTSILLNTPGESASVITCLDGYAMAREGRAGPALGIAAISSFIAGTFGVLLLTLIAPPIAVFSVRFGPPEYFILMLLGLLLMVFLTGESIWKGLLSGLTGLFFATIGIDLFTALPRFTYGQVYLADGIDFVVASIGLFAVAEVLANLEEESGVQVFTVPNRLRELFPSWEDLKACRFAFLNGSIVGFIVGVLPGAGSTVASILSYGLERAVSRHPEKFGNGAIEGVAAPEGANNSECGGAMVPLLTLGIPGSGAAAIMLGAFLMWGLKPGPMLFQEHPEFVWPLIASMYIGNVMLVILNLPLVPLFASILRVPYYVLYTAVMGLSVVGVYSFKGSLFDLWLLVGFSVLGYLMRKIGMAAAPMVLGLVLGPLMEVSLRQSMIMSHGSIAIFVERPISIALLITACLSALALCVVKHLTGNRVSYLQG
ncbi:MAG: tripartite tricarboxylate transporter permease [Deltaproteobacteria bacterium]|nr:tripartite tricarboxylate transporter permease [Deltaproteobacteria bacterium]